MQVFYIAILIGLVLKCFSRLAVNYQINNRNQEQLDKSIVFQGSVLFYCLNHIVLLVNITIVLALLVKTHLL